MIRPSSVLRAMNFNRSSFPTSDGSRRKKLRPPPKIHSVLPVLDFSFRALLFAYLLPAAAVQDSATLQVFAFPLPCLFLLLLPFSAMFLLFPSVFRALLPLLGYRPLSLALLPAFWILHRIVLLFPFWHAPLFFIILCLLGLCQVLLYSIRTRLWWIGWQ